MTDLLDRLAAAAAVLSTCTAALVACAEGPTEPSVVSVTVSPSAATLLSLGDTVRLTATAYSAVGDPLSGTAFTWSSSDASHATVDDAGLVTAVARGTAIITATTDGMSGTASVSIRVPTVEITPTWDTLTALGDTLRLAAIARDADGEVIVGATFSWESSTTGVAAVDGAGLVTAVGDGTATIAATTADASGAASVVVRTAWFVKVTPTDTLVMAGDTVRFHGVALDAAGDTIPDVGFSWHVGAGDVATVDDAGLAGAVGVGVTAITASAGCGTASVLMAVGTQGGPPPLYDHIAFEYDGDIWVIRPDGSNPVNLTQAAWGLDAADHQHAGLPTWSPDATKIAFAADGLYVINTAGAELQRLTAQAGVGQSTWSPDGMKIAYDVESSEPGGSGIHVMNADGSEQVNLTTGEAREHEAAWSPDGTRIAYSARIGSTPYDIYVMQPDGSNRVRLTQADSAGVHYSEPAWSPDGNRIAAWIGRGLTVMGSDGSDQRQITDLCCGGHPSWSPDASRIVFWALTPGSSYELLIIGADGSNLFRLAPGWTPLVGYPVWSRGP